MRDVYADVAAILGKDQHVTSVLCLKAGQGRLYITNEISYDAPNFHGTER